MKTIAIALLLSRSEKAGQQKTSEFVQSLIRWIVFLPGLLIVNAASAQSRPLPNPDYYQAPFVSYYQGDYRQALRNFVNLEKSAYKMGNQRWLDSICYWTMIGECHYQVGNYAEAIQFYEESIALYLGYTRSKWQERIQAIPPIQADNAAINRARITWGNPKRNFVIPRMPSTIGILFGEMNNEQRLQTGGVIQNPEVRSVDLTEIMRCTALAIYRRNQILGPTAKYSLTSNQIVAGLKGGTRQPGLFGAFNGVLLGLAQASIEDWDAAAQNLTRSLQFNATMDHPLTPLALLQLAHIGLVTKNHTTAIQMAMEASYSGAFFNQYDVIDDGLTLASQIQLMQDSSALAALPLAIDWARRERVHRMQTSLAIRLAESLGELGQFKEAGIALAQTNNANSRDSLSTNALGGRVKFIQALNFFQSGDFSSGMTELDAALKVYRPSSLWIFRLALTDTLTTTGGVGDRQADLLYASLLRDPVAEDWQFDPLETITFLTTDHLGPMERWFEVTVLRGDYERALEIAELTRRHRFFSQVPFGGRTLAFRWLLHAPAQIMSPTSQQQRREFLLKYPQYQAWINRTDQIQTALALLPVLPEASSDAARQQAKLFQELFDISQQQEAFLANCGLRRIPAEMVFPPQYTISEFRTRLTENQQAWVCFATARGYHRFLVKTNQIRYLGMLKERDVQRPLAELLKKMGVSEAAVDVGTLQSEEWKKLSQTFSEKLFEGLSLVDLSQLKELVIVPDGLLWYFPFESVQVPADASTANLIDKVEIRYSPTLFLAYDGRRMKRDLKIKAVVFAKIHAKLDRTVEQNAFTELITAIPDILKLETFTKKIQPEIFATQLDQLLVWNEIDLGRSSGLELAPIDLPQATRTPLRLWLLLPWRTPEHVIMPALQSDAGNNFRAKRKGSDLFMASLGMMASGTRSMIFSRWRTGGANSLAFSRNYFQRLGKMSTAQAFKESLVAARDMNLNYEIEPQIRSKRNEPVLKAAHPYFWSPYMRFEIPLADSENAAETPPALDPPAENQDGEKVEAEKAAEEEAKGAQPQDPGNAENKADGTENHAPGGEPKTSPDGGKQDSSQPKTG
jgi:tetratricopeptide (TPR) repeat protein